MSLREYRQKRDFQRTPEPRGDPGRRRRANAKRLRRRSTLGFVVQKHAASHLHYDFRLELDGVLKSWAVPKGPDLDPAVKRLAMQVEDHPVEYGSFEGTIPQVEYGGGAVMLWDRGTWTPVGDAAKGLRDGRLKFVLDGKKLRGGWMLVRRGGRKADSGERAWFLFKERDEFARTRGSITDDQPLSIVSGRTLEEIAKMSRRVWRSNDSKQVADAAMSNLKEAAPTSPRTTIRTRRRSADSRNVVSRRRRTDGNSKDDRSRLARLLENPVVPLGRLPAAPSVQLATLAKEPPAGDEWLHEIKFDGYRMLCRVSEGKARFLSRNGRDWTVRFPELAASASALAVESAVLDGEVVALDDTGVSSFQSLQRIFKTGATKGLVYYVFDLLHLNGRNVAEAPLERRKAILEQVVKGAAPSIRFSDHLEGSGEDVVAQACRMKLEGIVSKRRDRPYVPGRGLSWIKVKCSRRQEFVVGGFTQPGGGRRHLGALLLGYYGPDKALIYAGRVGTGFSDETLASLAERLQKHLRGSSPFQNLSGATGLARGVRWVDPVLVAEIEFMNWTDDGLLRHPSFQGLREDKRAADVVRDQPLSKREVASTSRANKLGANNAPRRRAWGSTEANRSAKKRRPAGDAKSQDAEIDFAGVRLTHPRKLLYPAAGVSKIDLAKYYEQVAVWMLPHVAGRPLAVVRCPSGSGKPCFFQKHPADAQSEFLKRVNVAAGGTPEYHLAIDDLRGLVSLVQMGVLEIHAWGSTAERLETPDRLVFDLDPDPSVEWAEVVKAAREVRLFLRELGLETFLKTTGGKGLHLVAPIQPRTAWDEAKAFCRAVANAIVRSAPDRYVATMSKAARKGKIFVDYLRNGRGATAIAPYSTRDKPNAAISAPIAWDELSSRRRSDHFTVANVPARLRRLGADPWAELWNTKQSITAATTRRLSSLS